MVRAQLIRLHTPDGGGEDFYTLS